MDAPDPAFGNNRRRPASSFSFTLCYPVSRRNRAAIRRLTAPSPACEESIHYPVFNPRDPRHNPDVIASPWLNDDYDLSQQTASPRTSRWIQDLPRRSLRRAHLGLLALRSGIRRRSSGPPPVRTDNPSAWSSADSAKDSLDQQGTLYSSTVSEASTAEDVDFGADLQRISCKYPSEPDGDISKYLQKLPIHVECEADGTFLNGSTVRHCRSEAVLAVPSFEVNSTESQHGHTARLQTTAFQGNHTAAEAVNESDEAVTGQEPRTATTTVSVRPNDSDEPSPRDSEMERSSHYLAAPGSSSNHDPDSQSQSFTRVSPNIHTASSSAPTNSRKSSALRMSINAINSYKPAMTRVCKTNRASETPQIIDADFAVESLKLCDRLGNRDSHAPEVDQESESPFRGFDQSEETPTRASEPCETEANTPGSPFPENTMNVMPQTVVANNRSADPDGSAHVGHEAATASITVVNEQTGVGQLMEESMGRFAQNEEQRFMSEMDQVLEEPWSTIDTDDLASLLALRDEYFLVDKSPDIRPDRDNNALKSERSFTGDGCLYSGPGLDRHSSTRTQGIPEIVGPRSAIQLQGPRSARAERDASDSTDEYVSGYPARYYFSSRRP
ncbi:hypothetical protein BO86DRAFT_375338 [Aspergillus japonicus CBS 114.51]|uniref:Uncharacterized protein n=2 Tax=Aspergillus TaxID=5052 RepID=A0A2V5I115_ASPV1|nr:hypothetical protein BO86DRAFT_375338 [Aspergillus japonicus CBS 114.51]PYI13406.1 hypothetical protein BO99DRAFT_477741 [Aspergillus violaceofuscus CBS 115571]RAH86580.1 hypothetical protein BO86DRAFT_375338 [Aspergillus japonicus CBS 114.51]